MVCYEDNCAAVYYAPIAVRHSADRGTFRAPSLNGKDTANTVLLLSASMYYKIV